MNWKRLWHITRWRMFPSWYLMNVLEKCIAFKIITQYLRDTLRPSAPEYKHEYYIRHRSELLEYQKEYRIKNRKNLRARQKELRKMRCHHHSVIGGMLDSKRKDWFFGLETRYFLGKERKHGYRR